MFEEPFRWLEAISTRHSYVQEKLRKGQPVIAVPYNEGTLMLGFSSQPGKIFELYDRIAMGGLGHPADVERLRMTLLDLAHLEGFNRSEKDVTLARLLQFGIAPALKQNFEEVVRAPYLIQLLLMEIDFDNKPTFFRVNYDGHWESFKNGAVIAGDSNLVDVVEKKIAAAGFATMPLDQALLEACRIWESAKQDIEDDDWEDPAPTLKDAFEKWTLEAAVLATVSPRKAIYRKITDAELETLKSACLS